MEHGRLRGYWNIDCCIYSKWEGVINSMSLTFISCLNSFIRFILQSLSKNMHLSLNGDCKAGLNHPGFIPASRLHLVPTPFWTFGGVRDSQSKMYEIAMRKVEEKKHLDLKSLHLHCCDESVVIILCTMQPFFTHCGASVAFFLFIFLNL